MKHVSFFGLMVFAFALAQAQGILITGKVTDATGSPLSGASVSIPGTVAGTLTIADGTFTLRTSQPLPLTLVSAYVGYRSQERTITPDKTEAIFQLEAEDLIADEVIVSASRIEESALRSPISIEKLDFLTLQSAPTPTFYDALEHVKGVQMTTLSLGFKVPNTRGFTGTTNSRFLQMVDGVDIVSPGIGAPVANAVGPTELDIQTVELIPGAASAIYGLNAINGIADIRTKSPFLHQGVSVYQRTGVNHVDGRDHAPSVFTESAVRYAEAFSDRFAFKINAAYSQGYDWVAHDTRDINAVANEAAGLTGANNPALDPVNSYGNESGNRRTISLQGKNYIVGRTGYYEDDFVDYTVRNAKVDAALHYRLSEKTEVSYSYRLGQASNMYQRGNRIRLDGLTIQQHKAEIRGTHGFFRAYYTHENTGNSYNARPMGENLDRNFKSDNQWFTDYTAAFNTAIGGQEVTVAQAHQIARAAADNGRYQPGTAEFEAKVKELAAINNWDKGAALILQTAFAHAEGQYDFSHLTKGVEVLGGFNARNYFIRPDGNSFFNPAGYTNPDAALDPMGYYSAGGFVQAAKELFRKRLKITGSLRLDKVQYFTPRLNPRIAAVYSLADKHHFRVSYQNGYRFPTLFEGFSYVDNGGIRRLGGLPLMSEYFQAFENSYLRTSQDAFTRAVNADVNKGLAQSAAIEKNKGLLVKNSYTYIKPEYIRSFEAGYKSILWNNRLSVDVDYYLNLYRDFIGQVEVARPNQGTIGVDDSTAYYAFDRTKNTRFRMWTNSTSIVTNQGVGVSLDWQVYDGYRLTTNYSFAALLRVSSSDALIPAFNTPKHSVNVSFGNREVVKNVGFNVVYHWQDAFYWQSPLADGIVSAYQTVDAQVNYTLPRLHTQAKLGASNLLNTRYTQYIGGPSIGGMYYLALTWDAGRFK